MLLVSCMKKPTPTTGTEAAGIESIRLYLTEVDGLPVSPMADDKQPHIMLDQAQEHATGFSWCNNFFVKYELGGSSL